MKRITTDCAHFFPEVQRCVGVTDVMCGIGTCPFYQTKEEKQQSLERWRDRMLSLPQNMQSYIAQKYYHGEYIWMEEAPDGQEI